MPGLVEHEADVADRAQPCLVRRRAVVVHADRRAAALAPPAHSSKFAAKRPFVTTWIASISPTASSLSQR